MKKIYSLLLITVIAFAVILTACSAKSTNNSDNNTENTTKATQAVTENKTATSDTSADVNTDAQPVTSEPDTTEFVPDYTKDNNETEILGSGNTVDGNQNNSGSTKTESVTEEPTQSVTEPLNPFATGEPIELPFVPAS